MPFGHNSNVRVGDTLYHVQTEDHGSHHPFIDTTVYCRGRVLHRRSTNYQDILTMGEDLLPFLQKLVEEQHKGVIEEIRAGKLELPPEPPPVSQEAKAPEEGLRVKLQNPGAWLEGTKARLKVQVLAKSGDAPVEGAIVEARIEGAEGSAPHRGVTDAAGEAEIVFTMPRIGPEGGALVICASSPGGRDEARFLLQARPRTPAGADVR